MTIHEFITVPKHWRCTEVHINGANADMVICSDENGFYLSDGENEYRTIEELEEAFDMEDLTLSIGLY